MRRLRFFKTLAAVVLAACFALPQWACANTQKESASNAEQGKALAFGRTKGNCLACHKIEGGKLPGTVGPELVNMKERYPDRELLFKRIWDESKFNPRTVMPPFGRNMILTRDEIQKIVDFLYTR